MLWSNSIQSIQSTPQPLRPPAPTHGYVLIHGMNDAAQHADRGSLQPRGPSPPLRFLLHLTIIISLHGFLSFFELEA